MLEQPETSPLEQNLRFVKVTTENSKLHLNFHENEFSRMNTMSS